MRPVSAALMVGLGWALCLVPFLGTQATAQVLLEDFNDNSIDPTVWIVEQFGSGPQLAETNQRLEILFPAASSGIAFGASLVSRFLLRGDFDVQADFHLVKWPFSNGVRLALATEGEYGMERTSFGSQLDYPSWPREVYLTDFPDGVHNITATGDMAGALRLVRTGATQTGYCYGSGQWVAIHTGPATTGDVAIQVHAWSHDYAFMDWEVLPTCDNLAVTSGTLVWPPSLAEGATWGSIKALYR